MAAITTDTLFTYFGHNWRTAFGVMMAESRGRATVTSANPDGNRNVGLFQIDTDTARRYGLDPSRLTDPLYNIHAASVISKRGTDWSHWATFKSGAYKGFLVQAGPPKAGDPVTPEAQAALAQHARKSGNIVDLGATGQSVESPAGKAADSVPGVGAIKDVASATVAITKALLDPKTWLHVLMVLGGVILGVFALRQLASVAQGGTPRAAPRRRTVIV